MEEGPKYYMNLALRNKGTSDSQSGVACSKILFQVKKETCRYLQLGRTEGAGGGGYRREKCLGVRKLSGR